MPIINLVYEAPKVWKPGINTRLYLPLNGDALDYSGNNNNGTWNGTADYRTIGDKQYAFFDGTSINLTSYPIDTGNPSPFTFSCMLKTNTSGRYLGLYKIGRDASSQRSALILSYRYSSTLYRHIDDIYGTGIYIGSDMSSPSPTETREHIVYTYNNGTLKLYINGVLHGTGSGTLNVVGGYNKQIGNGNGIGMSEVIFESGEWTQDSITKYFNRIKGFYGIS